jgi:two-component system sensor histidine kinase YesM
MTSRVNALLRNLNIKQKLILVYFLATILPIVLLGVYSYTSSVNRFKSQNLNLIQQYQQKEIMNITNRLDNYKFLVDTICRNDKIQDFVSGSYNTYYEEFEIARYYITPVINSLMNATGRGMILGIIRYGNRSEIIPKNFEKMLDTLQPEVNVVNNGTKYYYIVNEKRLSKNDWFIHNKGKLDDSTWMQVGSDSLHGNISLLAEVKNLRYFNHEKVAMLRVTVNLDSILGSNDIDDNSTTGFNMIFDKNNNLLSIEDTKQRFLFEHKDEIQKYLANYDKDNTIFTNKWIYVINSIEETGWKIITAFPIAREVKEINEIALLTAFFSVISITMLFVIILVISNSFSKRIRNISLHMEDFMKGSNEMKIVDLHNDEIGFLASVFNSMIQRINDLIRDNYQVNIDKKDAQLKVLQSQINPHFLYNSLSAINRLADLSKKDTIKDMITALTQFYNITLSSGKDIISIADEIKMIKAYINIYQIRKGDAFNIYYHINENILEYYTIKIILQPFVENIFEHAIYDRKTPININIHAAIRGNCIEFRIIDDGIGISRDRLKSILSKDTNTTAHGIRNVDDRIKLHFGNQYGVKIFSMQGIGTTAVITIPLTNVYQASATTV